MWEPPQDTKQADRTTVRNDDTRMWHSHQQQRDPWLGTVLTTDQV
jgi:hypothetical protein